MKKVISAVLTLLLISGCVAPPRQLVTSDAVADVSDSVQPEPLQKAPADICPEQKECPVLQPKTNWWAFAGWSVALLAIAYSVYITYHHFKMHDNFVNQLQQMQQSVGCSEKCKDEKASINKEIKRLRDVIEAWKRNEQKILNQLANPSEGVPQWWATEMVNNRQTIDAMQREISRLNGLLEAK
ncbi:MAG: hypothetical protein LE169_04160 [Endomicrobium sp.]|nr:hypothetical protein [Endomicrobium sp.]